MFANFYFIGRIDKAAAAGGEEGERKLEHNCLIFSDHICRSHSKHVFAGATVTIVHLIAQWDQQRDELKG